ncbi:uncharacterized protein LOC134668162 isoform X1 [Cydia fagiglandana]|uniref:uncharacterized protein LOC134668162 isoform X1 n=2 Tax=Cydia fagiglandana TaxID=1458189 RepID=UPI002FEDF1AF
MVSVQKIISLAKRLEDPKHPLLGPNLKGLYVYGLWQCGSKFRNTCYNVIHFCAFLFVISQIMELWIIRHDYLEALHNLSLTALGMVCIFKAVSYVIWQSDWKMLVEGISAEEISQSESLNDACIDLKQNYTNYARIVTYFYWNVVVSTNITMVSAPFLKYATSSEYREQISNGTEPLPQIFSSWFPFDKTTMPGYSLAIFIHILINIHGGGVIALYDSNAVAVMVFIRGQLAMLREKCKHIFDDYDLVNEEIILGRIKECHRHHNFILRQSSLFNSLLSPVMFLYVLVCSGMICCSVIQFTSEEATAAQKIWVLQYTTALVSQLFLYCWHSNEVVVECQNVDGGVYESEWWKGDARVRRQLAMLGGKLTHTVVFSAGPFATLCVPTFIDIVEHSVICFYGGGIVANYDANTVALMSFFCGQLEILVANSKRLFSEDNKLVSYSEAMDRIKQCHQHHLSLIKYSKILNSLLSPVMFLYVVICSLMICASAVLLTKEGTTTMQRMWVAEYLAALIAQLFLYCWHSNQVYFMSESVDRGIYESEWWRCGVRLRRCVVLLGGQLRKTIIFQAGPFTDLTVATFVAILKGSYSYYTLLSSNES